MRKTTRAPGRGKCLRPTAATFGAGVTLRAGGPNAETTNARLGLASRRASVKMRWLLRLWRGANASGGFGAASRKWRTTGSRRIDFRFRIGWAASRGRKMGLNCARFAAGIMAERAFTNPYPDYSKSQTMEYFDTSGRLTTDFSQRINNKIRELLQQMEIGLKSADRRDCTTYTGWAGIALLYLHLYEVYGDPVYLQMSHEYVKKSLNTLTKRTITFLCGDAGPLAIGAVVYHKMGNEKQVEDCLTRLVHLHKLDPRAPDEMLYGRMGYIYALLFVNKYFGQEKIPQHHIQQICDMVVSSGEGLARKRNFISKTPLMYEWYQEYYVGAAHGLAGIYYFLMQPVLQVSQVKLHNVVKPSVDYVCDLKFPSGNYPSCVDDTRDLLVHWCHGAPGVIYMLVQAYKIFNEEKYLNDAFKCADVIWKYGLLRKGYGLCHGVAGNAYAFLSLYKITHDVKYLYRACKFAEWCLDYGEHVCRTPDTPFSLFEGMAGTIYFLSDLLVPTKARFPAFEI